LNVGYHNEHHDLPSVRWNRLPKLKAIAPEWYDNLVSHRSWARLFWRFLSDSNLSLFSRMVRKNRGGLAVQAEV
jgi:sphingolipid 4-desaturase/C4-monooxygenase